MTARLPVTNRAPFRLLPLLLLVPASASPSPSRRCHPNESPAGRALRRKNLEKGHLCCRSFYSVRAVVFGVSGCCMLAVLEITRYILAIDLVQTTRQRTGTPPYFNELPPAPPLRAASRTTVNIRLAALTVWYYGGTREEARQALSFFGTVRSILFHPPPRLSPPRALQRDLVPSNESRINYRWLLLRASDVIDTNEEKGRVSKVKGTLGSVIDLPSPRRAFQRMGFGRAP
ncbi:predicted protein [Uncinocarpus reesii 1704]|uniref:Uncharacterized protein n=1 Tax=Uncinocarpus reesii (strain UAMH 1704) TaxID=336963 RepID=C4JZ71_UNCRE|nr:uncharacterized protein UREG_07472 [Uncinocarpus reesii 1704]EEP82607.1 predicted protein [Uncinocarpus reesii 1704]